MSERTDRSSPSEVTDGGVERAEGIDGEPGHREIEREIGHDEFDPVGTAVLVFIYFLIVVGLWLFMYVVEFLGNGPTVV